MTRAQYIEYLIATPGNCTCTYLADHMTTDSGTRLVSHDAISDFLRDQKMTPRSLWEVVAPLLIDSADSFLIVDDSVQDKRYSSKIAMVRRQYRGARSQVCDPVHGLVRGIGVVNLVHSSGAKGTEGHASVTESDFYPIDYRIFDPDGDGKTKHEHFREMLVHAGVNGCEPRAIKASKPARFFLTRGMPPRTRSSSFTVWIRSSSLRSKRIAGSV